MWDLFCEITTRPVILVVSAPKSLVIRYFLVVDGNPRQAYQSVNASPNDTAHDLRRRIAVNEKIEKEADIAILKVGSFEVVLILPLTFLS